MMKNFFTQFLLFLTFLFIGLSSVSAQNCNINAGGNFTICGTSYTLQGSGTGSPSGNHTWALVSKPAGAPDPIVSNVNMLKPNVTGMT